MCRKHNVQAKSLFGSVWAMVSHFRDAFLCCVCYSKMIKLNQ